MADWKLVLSHAPFVSPDVIQQSAYFVAFLSCYYRDNLADGLMLSGSAITLFLGAWGLGPNPVRDGVVCWPQFSRNVNNRNIILLDAMQKFGFVSIKIYYSNNSQTLICKVISVLSMKEMYKNFDKAKRVLIY